MRYRILIAEDEAVTRRSILNSLKAILPEEEFLLAENGAQAVAVAEESVELHMAFLDIKMPVLDGVQAARRIRARWSRCQIIFLTAYSDFEYMRQALDLEAVDYLLKPFSQTGLRAAVQKGQSRLSFCEQTRQLPGSQPQREIDALQRLAEQRLRPELAPERGEELDRSWDSAFQSGAFGVLRCTGGSAAQRLAGLVRGGEWEVRLKLLVSVSQDYVFLLLTSPVEEDLTSLMELRLRQLRQKAERILRAQVSGVVSYPLHGMSEVELASFHCFTALELYDRQGVMRLKTKEDAVVPSRLVGKEWESRLDSYIQTLFQYFQVQKFTFQMARMRAVNVTEAIYRARLGMHAGTEAFADMRRRMLDSVELGETERLMAAALEELCRPVPEELLWEQEDPSQRIRDYLNAHYPREITLESISADLGYSRTYFSRLFKQLFQENFVTYLTALRVEKAKELLRESELSVREVAQRTGFREGAYFASIFRRFTGETPREYRAREGV